MGVLNEKRCKKQLKDSLSQKIIYIKKQLKDLKDLKAQ
jgi:hypothetical protein